MRPASPAQAALPLLWACHCPPDLLAASCPWPLGAASRETSSVPAWIRISGLGWSQAAAETWQADSAPAPHLAAKTPHSRPTEGATLPHHLPPPPVQYHLPPALGQTPWVSILSLPCFRPSFVAPPEGGYLEEPLLQLWPQPPVSVQALPRSGTWTPQSALPVPFSLEKFSSEEQGLL